MNSTYWTSADIMELTGCSKCKASSILRTVNRQLRQKGYIFFRDRAPKIYILKALGIKQD